MEKNSLGKLSLYLLYTVLALVTLCAVVIFYATQLTDSDVWFHLAYGRHFLEHHTLTLDHSMFSWTPADNSTIYCSWIPQIIFYLMHQAFGISAFFVLRYLLVVAFLLFAFSFIRKIRVEYIPVVLLILLGGILMSISGIRIKPEIFSFILMTIMVWVWLKIKSSSDEAYLLCYIFPLITLIWVNSHGGFIFGIAFLCIVLAGEVINWASGSTETLSGKMRKHLFISILLSILAVFITPYGWDYPAYLINSMVLHPEQFKQDVQSIMEYQSIFQPGARYFHFIDYMVVLGGIFIALLAVSVMRKHKPDWALLLVNVCFVLLYMRYLRATYFWAVIATFSCLYLLQKASGHETGLSSGRPLKSVQIVAAGLLLFFSARASYEMYCSTTFGFRMNYYSPVAEAEYIRRNFPHMPIGNNYMSGAYLLWALGPGQKIFIDSRYFPYAKWFSDYESLEFGRDKTQGEPALLKKFRSNLWCVNYDFGAIDYFLRSPEWKLVFYGPSACVFLSTRIGHHNGHEVSSSIYGTTVPQALAIARFALKAGDVDVATRLLTHITPAPFYKDERKYAVKLMLEMVDTMYASGKYRAAADVCSRVIHIYPDSYDAFFKRGNSQSRIGDLNGAIESYSKAVRLRPGSFQAHHQLAAALTRANRLDEAMREYNIALKINPANAKARKDLLSVLQNKGTKAAGSHTGSAYAYFERGNTQAKSGDAEGAAQSYYQAIRIQPDLADAHFNLAAVLLRLKRVDEGIKEYSKALELDPGNKHTKKNLASTLQYKGNMQAKSGDIEGALKSYAEAIRLQPDSDVAHYNRAALLAHFKKFDDAIGEYKKTLEINPNHEKAAKNLKRVQEFKNKIDTEIVHLQQRIKGEPDNYALFQALAVCYANKGDYESSLAQLKLLLGKTPDRPDVHYNIACMYAKLGRIDDSIKWLDLAIQKGFADMSLLKKDSDLSSIRGTQYYRELIRKH